MQPRPGPASRRRGRGAAPRPSGRACRDAAAARTAPRTGASSTLRPAYITTTRSAISATTPRSWVIRMIAVPKRSLSSSIRSQDLRLDGDVERGGRLVGDQDLADCRPAPWRSSPAGACRRRAGADTRRARRCGSGMRTSVQHLDGALAAPRARDRPWCSSSVSAIWRPTVSTGLSEVIGSWKIIEMSLPRSARICALARRRAGRWPSKRIAAADDAAGRHRDQAQDRERGDRSCRSRISPTMPSVSPRVEVERDAVDRAHHAVGREEVGLQVVDLEDRVGACQGSHAGAPCADRAASRRPSPSRLTASTVSARKTPGKRIDVGADLEERAALGHDVAPARNLGRRAGAEEAEARLDQHRRGADVGRLHDQRRQRVGQDVARG